MFQKKKMMSMNKELKKKNIIIVSPSTGKAENL